MIRSIGAPDVEGEAGGRRQRVVTSVHVRDCCKVSVSQRLRDRCNNSVMLRSMMMRRACDTLSRCVGVCTSMMWTSRVMIIAAALSLSVSVSVSQWALLHLLQLRLS